MSGPFQGSGRFREGGMAAVHRHDFKVHVEGTGWRHTADQIDMNPPLANSALAAPTVQETLEKFLAYLTCIGEGFVTISDGYSPCPGSITVGDPATPDLPTAFTVAFSNGRLQNGGIVVLKAGTYHLDNTVTVPAGISIMGEVGGTIIIGQTNEKSLFKISRAVDLPAIGQSPTTASVEGTDPCRLFNLIITDNSDALITSGGSPKATMTTVPMISCENGSILHCDQVTFLGRMEALGAGPVFGRTKTLRAISYEAAGTGPSTLTINNCIFDGMQTAFSFNPTDSASTANVTNCRARTFGTELTADIVNRQKNCFCTVSTGNAKIANNFHTGGGIYVGTMITAIGATATITAVGNSGAPNSTPGATARIVSGFPSSLTFTSVISGNNWGGKNMNNEWFLTVGDGTNSIGDITGPNAIDTYISLFNASSGIRETLIVNPGFYTVNGGVTNLTSIELVGIKKNNSYPVLELDVTAVATDNLGNRFIQLAAAQSITFRSTGPTFHSVRFAPIASANSVSIVDCIFTDASLVVNPLTTAIVRSNILVDRCQFNQTGAYADNLSMLLPPGNVNVRNCWFRGNGYAAAVTNAGGYVSVAQTLPEVTFTNVTMDLTGGTITTGAPGVFERYFQITNTGLKIILENCRVVASNTFGVVTPIDAGLSGAFTRFIELNGTDISIYNCLFNGPQQTFTVGPTAFALPTVFVEPVQSFVFDTSRVVGGALPLQVSGTSAFNTGFTKYGIHISDSEFIGDSSNSLTMVDIDVELLSVFAPIPQIYVSDCLFQATAVTGYRIQHINNTGAYYDGVATLMIYAGQCDVNVTGNKVIGSMETIPTYTQYAGILINNYDTTTFPAFTGGLAVKTILNNNSVDINNFYGSVTVTDTAAAIWCRSPIILMNNNYVALVNFDATVGNFAGSLYLDNIPTTVGYSEGLVSGNVFSRRNTAGAAVSIKRGFIQITAASTGNGQIVDNSFSDTTIDGTDTNLLENNSTAIWLYERNKNQTETILLRGFVGRLNIGGDNVGADGDVYYTDSATEPTALTRWELHNSDSPMMSITIDNVGALVTPNWVIELYDVLPRGVKLVEIETEWEVGSTSWSVGSTIALVLSGESLATQSDTDLPSAAVAGTLTILEATLSPLDYYVTETFRPKITVGGLNLDNTAGAPQDLDFDVLSVKFRW